LCGATGRRRACAKPAILLVQAAGMCDIGLQIVDGSLRDRFKKALGFEEPLAGCNRDRRFRPDLGESVD
jgi:hypothetical protein